MLLSLIAASTFIALSINIEMKLLIFLKEIQCNSRNNDCIKSYMQTIVIVSAIDSAVWSIRNTWWQSKYLTEKTEYSSEKKIAVKRISIAAITIQLFLLRDAHSYGVSRESKIGNVLENSSSIRQSLQPFISIAHFFLSINNSGQVNSAKIILTRHPSRSRPPHTIWRDKPHEFLKMMRLQRAKALIQRELHLQKKLS